MNGLNFSDALNLMKEGKSLARKGWNNDDIAVMVQRPDDNSKMTEPYIYMKKGSHMFPLDLSAESIFAEDWFIVS